MRHHAPPIIRRAAPLSLLVLLLLLIKTSIIDALSISATSGGKSTMGKPRILCLHGKSQTGLSFSRKIGGARRKLERVYDLHFIDGPIVLDNDGAPSSEGEAAAATARAWFLREEGGDAASATAHSRHILIPEAFDYVVRAASQPQQQQQQPPTYDAIIGFSQGGTLATALAVSGAVPVRAVLTAGSPYVAEAFDVAADWASGIRGGLGLDSVRSTCASEEKLQLLQRGMDIPKLHLAGETDGMVPIDSTRELCERGGSGELVLHEKGHLFPTRAAHVDRMLQFLEEALAYN